MCLSPTAQSLNFIEFFGKFGKIICWYPLRGLAPPSAGMFVQKRKIRKTVLGVGTVWNMLELSSHELLGSFIIFSPNKTNSTKKKKRCDHGLNIEHLFVPCS